MHYVQTNAKNVLFSLLSSVVGDLRSGVCTHTHTSTSPEDRSGPGDDRQGDPHHTTRRG